MISEKQNTKLSKLLSYVLRHKPQEIGIVLDEHGWTDVQLLLSQLLAEGENIDLEILKHIVATNNKKRFAFNDDETKIRASQGHSVDVMLDYDVKQPPEFLYHGTVAAFIPAILKHGLQKMNRHHVHLSADTATAIIVAQRRGKPVILKIPAGKMFNAGHTFYISANGVWLTDAVPPVFIEALP